MELHHQELLKNPLTPTPSSLKVLEQYIQNNKVKEYEKATYQRTNTHWHDVFIKMSNTKKRRKISEKTLAAMEIRLQKIFAAIEIEYLEDLTPESAEKMNKWLYNNKLGNKQKTLSNKTIREYIQTFDQLIKCALITNKTIPCISNLLECPSKSDIKKFQENRRNPSQEELIEIFINKKYKASRYNINYPKFWIPLIALYTGCRLNEVCQLEVGDIITENGIHLFMIKETGDRQSVKNTSSTRAIPIHPVLIKLGLLELVEQIKNSSSEIKIYINKQPNPSDYKASNLFFPLKYTFKSCVSMITF